MQLSGFAGVVDRSPASPLPKGEEPGARASAPLRETPRSNKDRRTLEIREVVDQQPVFTARFGRSAGHEALNMRETPRNTRETATLEIQHIVDQQLRPFSLPSLLHHSSLILHHFSPSPQLFVPSAFAIIRPPISSFFHPRIEENRTGRVVVSACRTTA